MASSKLRWWHCLPISLLIHAVLLISGLSLVSDNLSAKVLDIPPVTLAHSIVVEPQPQFYLADDVMVQAPPAASIDFDPFELPQEEIPEAVPNLVFAPPTSPIRPSDPIPPLETPSDAEEVPSLPQEPASLEPLPTPDKPEPSVEAPAAPASDEAMGSSSPQVNVPQTDHEHLNGSKAASTGMENALESSKSSVSGKTTADSQDESAIWHAYSRRLSAHFKRYRHYPEMARKLRLTGTVWVIVELRRDGTLIRAKIKTSSGYPILDQAALNAVQKAVPAPPFPPETTATQKNILIPYQYTLQ